ncbi:MAG: ferrous iron transport protein A, partial [Tissierellia bacterium]|nr:ferrous iron transport protein A [Tissierellia bacterium]
IEQLGFVPGENIYIVHELGGNLIVNVKGCRVAISKSMANKIMVLDAA